MVVADGRIVGSWGEGGREGLMRVRSKMRLSIRDSQALAPERVMSCEVSTEGHDRKDASMRPPKNLEAVVHAGVLKRRNIVVARNPL